MKRALLASNNRGKLGSRSGSRFPQIANADDMAGSGVVDSGFGLGGIGGNTGNIVGVYSEQGKRPYQEDEYSIHPSLMPKIMPSNAGSSFTPATHFFGLYDGHAGGKCSKYVSSNLPDVLLEDAAYSSNLSQALKRSYLTANEQFLKIAEKMKLHDGSTGITCVIRDNILTVANVGDCRALVISSGRAIQMSIDQKPTSVEEQKRITQLGGTVVNCMGVARVNGVLAVSRAFGNRSLKQVIRPDAEVTTRDLQRDDEFLIMASDGLWDVLRNKDVSDIVAQLAGYTCQHIAEELVHTALVRGSMDNVTCIVVKIDACLALSKRIDGAGGGSVPLSSNTNTATATAAATSKGVGVSKTMSNIDDFSKDGGGLSDDGGSIIGSWAQPGFGMLGGGQPRHRSSSTGVDVDRLGGGRAHDDDDDDNASYIQPGLIRGSGGLSSYGSSGSGNSSSSLSNGGGINGGGGNRGVGGSASSITDFLTASGRSFMNGGGGGGRLGSNSGSGSHFGGGGLGFGGIAGLGIAPPIQSPIQSISKRPSTVGSFKSQGLGTASNQSGGGGGGGVGVGVGVGGYNHIGVGSSGVNNNNQSNMSAYRSSSMGPGHISNLAANESFNFNASALSNTNSGGGGGSMSRQMQRQAMSSPISFDFNSGGVGSGGGGGGINGVSMQNQQANMARPGTTASYNNIGAVGSSSTAGGNFNNFGGGNNSNSNSNSHGGYVGSTAGVSSVRVNAGGGGGGYNYSNNSNSNSNSLYTSGYAGIKKLSQQMQTRP